MIKVNFYNEKKYMEWVPLISELFSAAESKLDLPKNKLEINYTFCTPREIKKINKENRNVNKVTDVLSFPTIEIKGKTLEVPLKNEEFKQDINPETGKIILGDICICFKRIKKQAKEYENSIERELMYMSCHGLLHLLGYDHDTQVRQKEMRKKEETILHKLKIGQVDREE